jgi:hypothetical protein
MSNFPDGATQGAPQNFPNPVCDGPAAGFFDQNGPSAFITQDLTAVGLSDRVAYARSLTVADIDELTLATKIVAGAPVDPNLVINDQGPDGNGNLIVQFNAVADNSGGTWAVFAARPCGGQSLLGFVSVAIP